METEWYDNTGIAASNIIIEDCIIHDSKRDCIKLKPECDDVTIRYNEIYNSGRVDPLTLDGTVNAEGIDKVK